MASLAALQQLVHENNVAHGWFDDDRTFGDSIALIHSEVSEAFEEFRAGHALDEIYFGKDGKPEGIGIELADTMIRLLDTFTRCGLDAEKCIQIKHDFNETRPHKHGGKVL